MAEISKHIYPSDYTPGAPMPTCSPDPNHKMPICDLKNGGKDNLPPKYCLCPGPTPSISTPYSTTHTSLVSCETQLGTVTHLDVCPWTTTPPDSMKIDTTQHGSPYPAGTLPIVQTTTPSCVPRTAGADQPAFLGAYIMDTARRFCREAVDEKWTVGPGGAPYKFQTYDDADRARNSLGDPRPQRLTLVVQWDERACPADFDDDHYEFRDFDGCVKEMSDAVLKCESLLSPFSSFWFFCSGRADLLCFC